MNLSQIEIDLREQLKCSCKCDFNIFFDNWYDLALSFCKKQDFSYQMTHKFLNFVVKNNLFFKDYYLISQLLFEDETNFI